jgi:molecular chaperone GrpE
MTESHASPVRDGSHCADGEPAGPADASTDGRTDGRPDDSADQAAAEKVALERRVAELDDLWRRAVAELDNQRKRAARDLSRIRDQERAQVAAGWLPVVDNLELALGHAQASQTSQGKILEGLRAVHQQALDVLAGLGFPRREDVGKPFDPAHHEAVSTVPAADLEPGTVAHVLRAGYGSDDEVLRPASVVVATGSP